MTLDSGNFQNCLNDVFASLNKWFKVHKFILSFNKTSGMIPATNNKAILSLQMGCDKKTIKELLTTEFFGLKINSNINWRKCITYINFKLSLACSAKQHHTQKQRVEN
jgi:hypothetical protein